MIDVCLLVEGAYPYVTGGVSSWLHALISHLPDLTFAVVYIGPCPDPQRKALYTLPENVKEFREVFISDVQSVKIHARRNYQSAAWSALQEFHDAMAGGKPYDINFFLPLLREPGFAGLTTADLFHARQSWELIVKLYQLYAPAESFVDFFWTFRFTYLPVFTILETVLPQAGVYHAVSTGFSGLLGALAKIRSGRPFIVTEHGLYTREREIEIAQSTWMKQLSADQHISKQPMNFFQEWWFNIYRFMEKITYDSADTIISITSVNQQYQLKHGAVPRKMQLVPNGIDIERLARLRQPENPALPHTGEAVLSSTTSIKRTGRKKSRRNAGRAQQGRKSTSLKELHSQKATGQREMGTTQRFLIGFIGRIVSIKDVKTFIRAIKIVQQTIPDLEVYLVGPTTEEQKYFQDCCRLVSLLKLDAVVHFTGPADVRDYYRKLDVIILTSLSEGQPLVILEGNCAGIPVVATDVGACRELLLGASPEDQALGASGVITPVASPHETAHAIIQLWRDKDARLRMGHVGRERVRRFYAQEQLYSTYQRIYRSFIVSEVQK